MTILKDDAITLYYAWKHPQTPAAIKGLLVLVLGYIISPIDILPDYIPVIGVIDDLALIPIAVLSLIRMLPDTVRVECQQQSERLRRRMPLVIGLFILFITAWVLLLAVGIRYIFS